MATTCSKKLLFLSLFLLWMTLSQSQFLYSSCEKYNIDSESQYQTNLNILLTNFSSKAKAFPPGGFYNASVGGGTNDTVYGLFLCRGDQNATGCGDCVTTAAISDLPNTYCPQAKEAVIWYDQCMLRYSDVSFFGVSATQPMGFLVGSATPVGDKTVYTNAMYNAMRSMVSETATNTSGMKFTTKVVNVTSSIFLYALQQCTPDLKSDDCSRCLTYAYDQLGLFSSSRTLLPSCNVRYESYPFYIGALDYSSSIINGSKGNTSFASAGKSTPSLKLKIAVPISFMIVTTVAIVIYQANVKSKEHATIAFQTGNDCADVETLQYDFRILQQATDNFSQENKLGQGGFGVVYKGYLADGQEIAVKKLSRGSSQGVQEFNNEVKLLAKLQHRNLVRLLGFCLAKDEKLLVYEHVPNKSLDYFLFDLEKVGQLNWRTRYKIIGGVARGILYLHQDSPLRIIHRDLKPSNILLDMDLNPKIADFGMARMFGAEQLQSTTNRVVGTYGYMSPEYVMKGQFSIKSDAYSFGVMVLEIVSGKKISTFREVGYAEDLLTYAWQKWKDEALMELIDPTIRDSCRVDEAVRCMHLGLLCVQKCTHKRPTLAFIVRKLESYSTSLPNPEKPGFFIRRRLESYPTKDTRSTGKSIFEPANDMSITAVEAR